MTAMVGKGKFFVGGNWKCNETVAETKQLVKELNEGDVPDDIEIIVAPTYIHLQMVIRFPKLSHSWRIGYRSAEC